MKGLNEVSIDWIGNPAEVGEVTVGLEDGSYASAYIGSPAAVSDQLAVLNFPGLGRRLAAVRSALVGYVSAVEVPPRHRRRGLGSLLVRSLHETLSELGVRRVYLHAGASGDVPLDALRRFYEGLGFEEKLAWDEDRWPVMEARI